MISDIEISRAAWQLIKSHGDDADFEAVRRADAMLEKGNMEDQAVWKGIMVAVKEL